MTCGILLSPLLPWSSLFFQIFWKLIIPFAHSVLSPDGMHWHVAGGQDGTWTTRTLVVAAMYSWEEWNLWQHVWHFWILLERWQTWLCVKTLDTFVPEDCHSTVLCFARMLDFDSMVLGFWHCWRMLFNTIFMCLHSSPSKCDLRICNLCVKHFDFLAEEHLQCGVFSCWAHLLLFLATVLWRRLDVVFVTGGGCQSGCRLHVHRGSSTYRLLHSQG